MKNVRSEWQDKTDEEIKQLRNTLPLIVVTENTGDFNKGNILRTAEFFGASEFWIVGSKQWDRRSAVGAHHRLEMRYFPTWDECFEHIAASHSNYIVTALEQTDKAVSLESYPWRPNTILIVGEEGAGINSVALERAHEHVQMDGGGAVRSLNVAVAAGIAIHAYATKFTKGLASHAQV